MSDKQRIAATFAAAAPAYDAHAVVQRHAAQQLAQRVQAQWPSLTALPRIVEIGCGTGNLTEALWRAYPHCDLLATDLAPAMVQACQQRMAGLVADGGPIRFAVVDGEHWDGTAADLVASSLVFQWFGDQRAALARLATRVPRLAVATLLDGTFAEWKSAHAAVGVDDGVRTFMTEDALRVVCANMAADCTVVVETVVEHYPDVLQFVRSLKAIGAGTARPGHRPVPLRRVLRMFPQGISASYRVAYVLAENTSLLGH